MMFNDFLVTKSFQFRVTDYVKVSHQLVQMRLVNIGSHTNVHTCRASARASYRRIKINSGDSSHDDGSALIGGSQHQSYTTLSRCRRARSRARATVRCAPARAAAARRGAGTRARTSHTCRARPRPAPAGTRPAAGWRAGRPQGGAEDDEVGRGGWRSERARGDDV